VRKSPIAPIRFPHPKVDRASAFLLAYSGNCSLAALSLLPTPLVSTARFALTVPDCARLVGVKIKRAEPAKCCFTCLSDGVPHTVRCQTLGACLQVVTHIVFFVPLVCIFRGVLFARFFFCCLTQGSNSFRLFFRIFINHTVPVYKIS
jgi:hypothetical protein